jgi:hypothetical protein
VPLTCRHCSRNNPSQAFFCWYDGIALDTARPADVALPAGRRPFPMPFIFPSGRACRNFDELVLACEALWKDTLELLRSGDLAAFLSGLGRSDLSQATRQAARHPDPDRGLDDLLSRFPATSRTPALLSVAPAEVNLGRLDRTTPRTFQLRLENSGMGLLTGSLSCENTPWLTLGDAHGSVGQKLFQTRHEQNIRVHVNVKALPAGNKTLEGRIVVESNGGTTVVHVRAEPLPVQPFPEGVLAGSRTPRQIAEKARANPREAALLFERGLVAAWYSRNGWVYPVQTPASSGLAVVQQFFEALGLVKPPRVEVLPRTVDLTGAPGTRLETTLLAHTLEKRAVWAHATTDAPWLQPCPAQLDGRTARLRLVVDSVPSLAGSQLEADVNVTANGNQRFTVRVRLIVTGRPGSNGAGFSGSLPAGLTPAAAQPAAATPWFVSPPAGPAPIHASVSSAAEPLLVPVSPMVRRGSASVRSAPAGQMEPNRGEPVLLLDPAPAQPQAVFPSPTKPYPAAVPFPPSASSGVEPLARLLAHLALLVVLFAALFVVGLHDLIWVHSVAVVPEPPSGESEAEAARRTQEERKKREEELARAATGPLIDPHPYLQPFFHQRGTPEPNLRSLDQATMRFGLRVIRDASDPPSERGEPRAPTRLQRLTFHEKGATNNTCLRIDDKDFLFGSSAPGGRGHWLDQIVPLGKDRYGRDRIGYRSIWQIDEANVLVTQEVEVVASGVRSNEKVRRLDTCLVTYTLENKDTEAHKVGLRFLLDTFIGENDGVPFFVPNADPRKQLFCSTNKEFYNSDEEGIPNYIEAYENNDLSNPGTIARLTLRVSEQLEPPGRVTLGGWPDPGLPQLAGDLKKPNWFNAHGPDTLWEVPVLKIAELRDRNIQVRSESGVKVLAPADSAVTMYWGEQALQPGKKRHVGFAYGLGSVSAASPDSKMLLTLGRPYEKKFTATALVLNPVQGETLTLTLPDGLVLDGAGALVRDVPLPAADAARPISAVTWSLRAERAGDFVVQVKSSRGFTEKQTVTVRSVDRKLPTDPEKGIFD